MEWIGIVVDILALFFAILFFAISSRKERKATEEQTRQERIRATLTDFTALRREHVNFKDKIENNKGPEESLIRTYLSALERFAVGWKMGAYDLEAVNNMSGGLLINQYRDFFKNFIIQRRNAVRLESAINGSAIYMDYILMMKALFLLRNEEWDDFDQFTNEQWVLQQFLQMPISSVEDLFAVFRALPGAIESRDSDKESYLYFPGTKEARCLLVVHINTSFENEFHKDEVSKENGYYKNGVGTIACAECAILWLLRKSGHSLLLLRGKKSLLKNTNSDFLQEINKHCFIISFNLWNKNKEQADDLPVSKAFQKYIKKEIKSADIDSKGQTDIHFLCEPLCGVDFCIGGCGEDTPHEAVNYAEWKHTLDTVQKMLENRLKNFSYRYSFFIKSEAKENKKEKIP